MIVQFEIKGTVDVPAEEDFEAVLATQDQSPAWLLEHGKVHSYYVACESINFGERAVKFEPIQLPLMRKELP